VNGAVLLIFCRWSIGLTFAVSALGKASAMGSFRDAIVDFGLLPARLAGAVAGAVAGAEGLVAALEAVGGVLASAGFALGLALLAGFSAILVRALRKKADLSCNCFGPGERKVSWFDVARNALLALCCAGGLWTALGGTAGRLSAGLVLALGLVAAGFVIVVTALEDITVMLRKPHLAE
jgi:Methylamine utilisation protein MauE